jgi:PKD repeat protein
VASPSNVVGTLVFDWNFGDGSPHSSNPFATHTYAGPGSYRWRLISSVTAAGSSASTTNTGTVLITAPAAVAIAPAAGGAIELTWPMPAGDALLEETSSLNPSHWQVVTNEVFSGIAGTVSVVVPAGAAQKFYRLRQL